MPEGAFFLWLWFPGLPITSRALYERLKARGVLVVSGDWFFPGLAAGWSHTDGRLRLTYSQDEAEVRRGIALIADEIRADIPTTRALRRKHATNRCSPASPVAPPVHRARGLRIGRLQNGHGRLTGSDGRVYEG